MSKVYSCSKTLRLLAYFNIYINTFIIEPDNRNNMRIRKEYFHYQYSQVSSYYY